MAVAKDDAAASNDLLLKCCAPRALCLAAARTLTRRASTYTREGGKRGGGRRVTVSENVTAFGPAAEPCPIACCSSHLRQESLCLKGERGKGEMTKK